MSFNITKAWIQIPYATLSRQWLGSATHSHCAEEETEVCRGVNVSAEPAWSRSTKFMCQYAYNWIASEFQSPLSEIGCLSGIYYIQAPLFTLSLNVFVCNTGLLSLLCLFHLGLASLWDRVSEPRCRAACYPETILIMSRLSLWHSMGI